MERSGVLKELADRRVVVLSPNGVERLRGKATVIIQHDAGRAAGFTNEAYAAGGAQVVAREEEVIAQADVLVIYDHHYLGGPFIGDKTFIGSFNFLGVPSKLDLYQRQSVSAYRLDLMPRTTLAHAMDVLSSVGSISGNQAVFLAAERSLATVPMITGASGTLRPANFLIMGAVVTGLQAIATVRRSGAVVKAYDVRSTSKEEVESLGAEFIEVEGAVKDRSAGGYAVQQSEAFLQQVRERIASEAA